MDELEAILPHFEINKCSEESQEIKECQSKANLLCAVIQETSQKIHELMEENERLKLKESEMHEVIKSNGEKICAMKKKIENLQGKYESLVNSRKEYMANSCTNFKQEADATTTVGNNMMDMLDLKIKVEHIGAEIWEIKFTLLADKEITLHFNIREKIFDLQSMEPNHPRFTDLKSFLNDSSDISGFLYYARKFYLRDK